MPEIKTWGASPDDWDHFDIILGLGADLLPVVSNPSAVVSKRSTIRALGKVPSLYNKEGKERYIAYTHTSHNLKSKYKNV